MRTSKCTQYICVTKLMAAFIFSDICIYFLNIFISIVVNLFHGIIGSFSVKSDKVSKVR